MIIIQTIITHHTTGVIYSSNISPTAIPKAKGMSNFTEGYINKSIFFFTALSLSCITCKCMKKF